MRDKGERTLAQGDRASAEVIAIGIVTTVLVFALLSVAMAAGEEQHEQARRVFERQVHALHSPYTIQEDIPEDSSAASSIGVPSFFIEVKTVTAKSGRTSGKKDTSPRASDIIKAKSTAKRPKHGIPRHSLTGIPSPSLQEAI